MAYLTYSLNILVMKSSIQLLDIINDYIRHLAYSRPPKGLYDPIEYVLSLGGKRIRPLLMLMAYNLYKENVEDILSSASAIEIYHNYTLLHDDLMDCADMRRNKPTVHKLWNDNAAILSGDTMLVLAYKMMSKCESIHLKSVLDVFSETALEIGEGQQYDMEFENRNDVSEEEYIEMIRLKTSVLLAASLQIGAILADAPQTDTKKLYDFGIQIGLAFQLQDDLLDVYGNTDDFGKKIGGDILCNKKTYMLINAFQLADKQQRSQLDYWISQTQFDSSEKIKQVTSIYNDLGIKDLCRKKINEYFQTASVLLSEVGLPDSRKSILKGFADSLMNRKV